MGSLIGGGTEMRVRLGAMLGGLAGVIIPLAFWQDDADVILLFILPPSLASIGAACGAVTRHRRWPILFVGLSLAAGFLFWWTTDWGVYVEGDKITKFELAPVEQFAVSALVGVALGGIITGAVLAMSRMRLGRNPAWRPREQV
jgi:hypothetical protein